MQWLIQQEAGAELIVYDLRRFLPRTSDRPPLVLSVEEKLANLQSWNPKRYYSQTCTITACPHSNPLIRLSTLRRQAPSTKSLSPSTFTWGSRFERGKKMTYSNATRAKLDWQPKSFSILWIWMIQNLTAQLGFSFFYLFSCQKFDFVEISCMYLFSVSSDRSETFTGMVVRSWSQ